MSRTAEARAETMLPPPSEPAPATQPPATQPMTRWPESMARRWPATTELLRKLDALDPVARRERRA